MKARHPRQSGIWRFREQPFRLRRPITWWRHSVIQVLEDRDKERLSRAISAETARRTPHQDVAKALKDPALAFRHAIECHPGTPLLSEDLDLAMSWALLAFVGGQKPAALLIAESVRQLLERIDQRAYPPAPAEAEDLQRLRIRMHLWFQHYAVNGLFFGLQKGEPGILSGTTAEQHTADLTLIPVKSIPTDGKWGKDIAKRYHDLTVPMSLRRPRDPIDLIEIALAAEMPWCLSAIESICSDLRLQVLGALPIARFRPTLLAGPPGIGKTRFARRLAKHLNLPIRFVNCAGGSSYDLIGLSRVYESTQPGIVPRTMMETRIANPIILLDEIDKAPQHHRERRLVDALLPVLESETAAAVPDECLITSVNMSATSWLFTANNADGLPRPFLDRLRIATIGRPDISDIPAVIRGITREVAVDHRIDPADLPDVSADIVTRLIEAYRDGASLRVVKRAVIAAIAAQLKSSPKH